MAQSLLNRGLTTIGAIESVDVKTQPRGRGSKKYITTVHYRFVAPDGQVYRGSSSHQGDELQRIAPGGRIEIVHDPHRPSITQVAKAEADGYTLLLNSSAARRGPMTDKAVDLDQHEFCHRGAPEGGAQASTLGNTWRD